MENRKIIISSTAAALCISLGAYAGDQHAKHSKTWGHSDEGRHASSPAPIVEENAAQEGFMSTVDTTPGKLSAEGMRKDRMRQGRAEWREDRAVYRSGSPTYVSDSSHSHYSVYGDDLAALKGIQLELALNHLHHMNQAQIGLAKMAETKAKSATVLNLAHQIRADHERMEKKVEQIADARDIDLENFELNTYEKVVRNRLTSLESSEFEDAFLRVIDRNHDMAAADLRMIRDDIDDAQVTALVSDALPVMQAHKDATVFRGRAGLEEGDIGEE